MLVRMKTNITGTRDGIEWPHPGGTIDLPDQEALDLIAAGYAEEAQEHDDAQGDQTAVDDADTGDAEPDSDEDPGADEEGDVQHAAIRPARGRRAKS